MAAAGELTPSAPGVDGKEIRRASFCPSSGGLGNSRRGVRKVDSFLEASNHVNSAAGYRRVSSLRLSPAASISWSHSFGLRALLSALRILNNCQSCPSDDGASRHGQV